MPGVCRKTELCVAGSENPCFRCFSGQWLGHRVVLTTVLQRITSREPQLHRKVEDLPGTDVPQTKTHTSVVDL